VEPFSFSKLVEHMREKYDDAIIFPKDKVISNLLFVTFKSKIGRGTNKIPKIFNEKLI